MFIAIAIAIILLAAFWSGVATIVSDLEAQETATRVTRTQSAHIRQMSQSATRIARGQ